MRVLGLDIATVTGWCERLHPGQPYITGEFNCTPSGKDEPEGVRYHQLWAQLQSHLYRGFPPDAVVIEEPFTMSKRGAHVLGGLIAAAEIVLEERGIPYVFVNANTLKAWARNELKIEAAPTGTGDATSLKEGMRLEAVRILGRELTNNESDAYWLVQWFLAHNEIA